MGGRIDGRKGGWEEGRVRVRVQPPTKAFHRTVALTPTLTRAGVGRSSFSLDYLVISGHVGHGKDTEGYLKRNKHFWFIS